MDQFADEVIRQELSGSEKLLWAGRPRQGFVLRPADWLLIPFSLLWAGFALFWEAGVLVQGAPWFFALWGIPFVLMGLYVTVGRFWVDARQRAATTYGVTSDRVVIVSGLFARSVKSLNLDTLTDVSLSERTGSGTIMFGALPMFHSWYFGTGWPGPGQSVVSGFDLAGDAREVYEIIRAAQRKSKGQT